MMATTRQHQMIARALYCGVMLIFCAVSTGGYSSAAHAAPVNVPSSTSPGQVEKRFQEQPTAPSVPGNLQLPQPSQAPLSKEAQEQLAKKKFTLKNVVVEGVTLYKADDLKFAYEDLLGQTISLLDAQEIARKVTNLYHNNGYVLSQAIVPPQDITGGTLKIRVIEGYVGNTIIQGDVSDAERKVIEAYARHVQEARPVRTQDLERYLLLINDLPGVGASGLLRPSPAGTGSADLVLTISRQRYDGSYVFDDRGSRFVGPWQHTAAVAANSILNSYDRSQFRFFTTTPDSSQLLGLEFSHQENLDSEGTMLTLLASRTHTRPGDSLAPLGLNGNSYLGEAKVTHPFIRQRQENLVGRFMLDYHDTITDIFGSTPFTSDRLRIARAGGNYNIVDGWRGNNLIDVQVSQGLNVFGASSRGAGPGGGTPLGVSLRSNGNGDSDFTKFNADLSRLQPLPQKFSLLTAATAQYSFNPLLADEQFGLGGADWARAFDPSEVLGDSGLAGKAELRYSDSVGKSYFDSYQLYTFYDLGRIWVTKGAPGANDKATLSSTGVGTRLTLTDNFSANFEADVPLIKAAVDQTKYRHDPRLFMSLVARF